MELSMGTFAIKIDPGSDLPGRLHDPCTGLMEFCQNFTPDTIARNW